MTTDILKPANLCCLHSDCRKDTRLYHELEMQLRSLELSQQITLWHPRDLQVGQFCKKEIAFHISTADISLLLLSSDFLASSLYEEYIEVVLHMYYSRQTHVIPIYLRPCWWRHSPILYMKKVLPRDGRPITNTRRGDRDAAFYDVIQELYSTIMSVRTTPRRKDLFLNGNRRFFSIPFVPKKLDQLVSKEGWCLPAMVGAGLQVSGPYELKERLLLKER